MKLIVRSVLLCSIILIIIYSFKATKNDSRNDKKIAVSTMSLTLASNKEFIAMINEMLTVYKPLLKNQHKSSNNLKHTAYEISPSGTKDVRKLALLRKQHIKNLMVSVTGLSGMPKSDIKQSFLSAIKLLKKKNLWDCDEYTEGSCELCTCTSYNEYNNITFQWIQDIFDIDDQFNMCCDVCAANHLPNSPGRIACEGFCWDSVEDLYDAVDDSLQARMDESQRKYYECWHDCEYCDCGPPIG